MRRRAGACAGIALALGGSSLMGAPACTTHACDPNVVDPGAPPASGVVIASLPDGEYIWRTSSVNADWIQLAAAETYVLHFPVPLAEDSVSIDCDISANFPDEAGQSFVPAGTSLSFNYLSPTSVNVVNLTCALYALRCTVSGFIVPAADAGADAPSDDATAE